MPYCFVTIMTKFFEIIFITAVVLCGFSFVTLDLLKTLTINSNAERWKSREKTATVVYLSCDMVEVLLWEPDNYLLHSMALGWVPKQLLQGVNSTEWRRNLKSYFINQFHYWMSFSVFSFPTLKITWFSGLQKLPFTCEMMRSVLDQSLTFRTKPLLYLKL